MAIIKQLNKKNGTTYVYETIDYWDEEKKINKPKRRLIGKLDLETGDVVPTNRRGNTALPQNGETNKEAIHSAFQDIQKTIYEVQNQIKEKDIQLAILTKQNQQLNEILNQMERVLKTCIQVIESVKRES